VKVCGIICALIAIAASAMAAPVGTAFTYQGKLTDSSGNPVSGTRDMTFKVFDALTAGNQVGATVAKLGVNVSGGLFTVQLDFSIGVFLGEKRWLEAAVAGETMSPRVELTPTPNAIVAANALEIRGYGSALVGVADIMSCILDGSLTRVPKQAITLALAYGQTVTLDLLDVTKVPPPGDPYPLENIAHLEISKTKRQLTLPDSPDTQVPLADSPVVTIKLCKGSSPITKTITISQDDPVYSTSTDPACIADPSSCPINLRANLLSDSGLRLVVDKQQVRVVTTDSLGAISSAWVAPYKEGAREAELTVTLWNAGDYKADFIVTVTELGPYVEPVAAQSVTLNPGYASVQKFTLRSTKPFTGGNTYRVTMKGADGTPKDYYVLSFPEPTAP